MVLDPLSAIGLAGNVITFVEFGCSLLSKSREIYVSASGSTSENDQLEIIAMDLRQHTAKLRPPDDRRQIDDEAFVKLLDSCHQAAEEFLDVIQQLKVKGTHRRWHSFRKAVASVWAKDKLSAMQSRLDSLRGGVVLHVMSCTRYAFILIFSIRQSS